MSGGKKKWTGWKRGTKITNEGNKVRLNYSKEGEKNNSSVNSRKIDRKWGRLKENKFTLSIYFTLLCNLEAGKCNSLSKQPEVE
jgi:hypothetical protein